MPATTIIPNVDVSMAARQYVSAGFVLVPIAKNSKGPNHKGWSKREQCIDTEDRAVRVRSGVGLAHAYSRTCCVDLDDVAKCREWLGDYIIDLDALMAAPDAVHILSGRENRGKLLYRLPDDVDPLITVKVAEAGLELRCGTRDGTTVQDVLPPSLHPMTMLPYKWGGRGEWSNPPVLPAEILDLWRQLEQDVEPARAGAGVADGDPEDDPMVRHLDESGRVRAKLRDGTRHIHCPFEHEHTTPGTLGDCSYFPALTGGYANGHFKCLHNHCAHRTDEEFIEGVGFDRHAVVAAQFDVVVNNTPALPGFKRDKNGRIEATIENVVLGSAYAPFAGFEVAFDTFRDEIMLSRDDGKNWESFRDTHYVELRIALERRGFKSIGREVIRDAVAKVAEDRQFDSAQLWLDSLQWDGKPRIEAFLADYWGASSSAYHRAVSTYLWTALAGRVLQPGIKADMVPIFVGRQGIRKSSGVAAMVPHVDLFAEISFHEKEQDLSRKMRGRLIAEIGELRGLHSREVEHIKAFITRTHEDWTPKYREFNTRFARRLVFAGTTNKDEFLADETGNRRFLPVNVSRVDVERIEQDRDQLWAEARIRFMAEGILWQDAEKQGAEVHHQYMMRDAWEDAIEKWLGSTDVETCGLVKDRTHIFTTDVLVEALLIDSKLHTRQAEMRVGNCLRALGYERKKLRVAGRARWAFVPTVPTDDDFGGNVETPF